MVRHKEEEPSICLHGSIALPRPVKFTLCHGGAAAQHALDRCISTRMQSGQSRSSRKEFLSRRCSEHCSEQHPFMKDSARL